MKLQKVSLCRRRAAAAASLRQGDLIASDFLSSSDEMKCNNARDVLTYFSLQSIFIITTL